MITTEELQKLNLIQLLGDLGTGKTTPANTSWGVCYLIKDEGSSLKKLTKALMATWPKSSGCTNFPVPHPTLGSGEAFMVEANLWEGEYGTLRRELCLFLRDELKRL